MYRRVELAGPGEVVIKEHPSPEMRPDCVRMRVEFCSINRADLERIKGSYGGVDLAKAAFAPVGEGARVPGYEPAGVVTEIADDVEASLLGARVVLHSHTACGNCEYCLSGLDNLCSEMRVYGGGTPGYGGWSEEIVVPAKQLLVVPDHVDLKLACTYEVTYGTALFNLRRGVEIAMRPGTVAVRGVPGGVALAAVQLCVVLNLPVVAIVRDPNGARAELIRKILPGVPLVAEKDAATAVAIAGGGPPSVIIEPLGGSYVQDDVELVAHGGAVGVLGGHLGVAATVRLDAVFHKCVAIYGTPRGPMGTMLAVADMVSRGTLEPIVDRVFPLTDVREALEYCDAPTGIGRVLLSMENS